MVDHRRRAEISLLTDEMLLNNIKAVTRVLTEPEEFPRADLDHVRTWYDDLTAAAAARGIFPISN